MMKSVLVTTSSHPWQCWPSPRAPHTFATPPRGSRPSETFWRIKRRRACVSIFGASDEAVHDDLARVESARPSGRYPYADIGEKPGWRGAYARTWGGIQLGMVAAEGDAPLR